MVENKVEVWISNKGKEEIHYFIADEPNTYIFGINEQLLGEECHQQVLKIIKARVKEIYRRKK